MPYMRVKPVGAGTPGDPIRCPIPSYTLVADLGGAAGWVVFVRDEDVPAGSTVTQLVVPGVGNVQVVTALTPAQLAAWQAQLDSRYPQRDKSVVPQIQ